MSKISSYLVAFLTITPVAFGGPLEECAEFFDTMAPNGVRRPTQVLKPTLAGHSARDVLDLIKADLARLPPHERKQVRYFSFASAAAQKLSPAELKTQREAFVKLLNSVSWAKDLILPETVDQGGLVLRVNVDPLEKASGYWYGRIARETPHTQVDFYAGQLERDFFSNEMGIGDSSQPFLNVDAFIATVSKAEVYNNLMGLDGLSTLRNKLGAKREPLVRAGFSKSGVSNNNRVIERSDTDFGYLWVSRDFQQSSGYDRRNIFEHPVEFTADGGEVIFTLPNGMQGYMIVDNSGEVLKKAPITVVSDIRRPDRAVENGISCMRCHAGGLLVASDEIKNHVHANPSFFFEKDVGIVEKLHADNDRLKALIKQDTERYQATLRQMSPEGQLDPITAAVSQFEKDVHLETALAELDLSADDLSEVITANSTKFVSLLPLLQGKTIPRDTLNLHLANLRNTRRKMLASIDQTLNKQVRIASWSIQTYDGRRDLKATLTQLGRNTGDLKAKDVEQLIRTTIKNVKDPMPYLSVLETSFFPKVIASERNVENFKPIALLVKQHFESSERKNAFQAIKSLFPNPTPSEFENLAKALYPSDYATGGELFDGLLTIYYPHLTNPKTAQEIVEFNKAPFSAQFRAEVLTFQARKKDLTFLSADVELLRSHLPPNVFKEFVDHNRVVSASKPELERLLARAQRIMRTSDTETFTFEEFINLENALPQTPTDGLSTFRYAVLHQNNSIQVKSIQEATEVVKRVSAEKPSYAVLALTKFVSVDPSFGSYADLKSLMNLEIRRGTKVMEQPEFADQLPLLFSRLPESERTGRNLKDLTTEARRLYVRHTTQLFSTLRDSEKTARTLADLTSLYNPGEKGLVFSKEGPQDLVIRGCLDQLTGGSRSDYEALLEFASENQLRKKIKKLIQEKF